MPVAFGPRFTKTSGIRKRGPLYPPVFPSLRIVLKTVSDHSEMTILNKILISVRPDNNKFGIGLIPFSGWQSIRWRLSLPREIYEQIKISNHDLLRFSYISKTTNHEYVS